MQPIAAWKLALASLVVVAGCGHSTRPVDRGSDGEAAAVARARAVPAFAPGFDAAPPILRHGSAFVTSTSGFRVAGARATRVELPGTANGTIQFLDEADGPLLSLRPLGSSAQKGTLVGGALAYADIAPEMDAVIHAVPSGIEELRVLNGPRAPHSFRWALTPRSGHHARLVEGRVEIVDASGDVRLRSELAFAVDAAGVRRNLDVRLSGDEVSFDLDTVGLRYPIVVDPTWIQVVLGLTGTSNYYGYSWVQPTPNLLVQLGGSNNVNDGSAWFDVPTEKWTLHVLSPFRTHSESIWVPSIGKALIVGGESGGGGFFDTASLVTTTLPTFSKVELTSKMTIGRSRHTLTLVNAAGGERVLVVGGNTGTVSVDWFDPSTSTFTARTPMGTARRAHAATLLASGKVLVTGGSAGSSAFASGEVYDPLLNTWTPVTNSMAIGRRDHRSVRLPDNRVLVIGGDPGVTTNATHTTSIYDPTTNAFTAGPTMAYERNTFTATTLPDGKVLVAGGVGRLALTGGADSPLSTTEIYDPSTNTFTAGPTMKAARGGHEAVLLSSGRVMVGSSNSASTTEILWPDPTTCTTTSTSCPVCIDGVCCDTACTGQCDACDVPGRVGVCSPVSGEAPHGTRATCSPFSVCVYSSTTASSACATSCSSDAACGPTSYCVTPGPTGTCAAKHADGAGCSAAGQCTSGFCADGVCCKTSCTAQCQSCAESATLGTCVNVDGPPRGTKAACAAPYACSAGTCATSCTKDVECATGRSCDLATNTCVAKKGNGSACTAASQCVSGICVDGTCCNSDCTNSCFACDVAGRAGTCSAIATDTAPHGTRSCSPFALCGAGACKTSCATGADCLSGVCDSATSTCGATPDAGPADATSDTSDGSVVDSAIDSAVPAMDSTPVDSTPFDLGIASGPAPDAGPKPTIGEFQKCSKGSECATGFCVEGVCCNSACTDKCSSCALLTSPGICTVEPVGVDLKNECGPALSCLGTCDGSGQCIGAGTGTMCGRNRCTGSSTGVGPAYCPAPGAKCATEAVVAFDCAPYVCEPAFGACASGCKASSDCANGFVCDVPSKTCVAPAPPEEDSGCGVAPGRAGHAGFVVLGLLAAALRVRRRPRLQDTRREPNSRSA